MVFLVSCPWKRGLQPDQTCRRDWIKPSGKTVSSGPCEHDSWYGSKQTFCNTAVRRAECNEPSGQGVPVPRYQDILRMHNSHASGKRNLRIPLFSVLQACQTVEVLNRPTRPGTVPEMPLHARAPYACSDRGRTRRGPANKTLSHGTENT